MICWLLIQGNPTRAFYSDVRALAFIDPQIAKHQMVESFGTLADSSDGSAETQNVTVKLSLEARQFFKDDPPIGAQASIESDVGQQFAGTIQTCSISASDHVPLAIEQ